MFLDSLVNRLHKSIFRYQDVLNYLHSRQITDTDIRTYELGYNKIIGVPEDPNPERQRFMDDCNKGRKLENKIIFPIKDALGHVVGIIGRSIETKEFKKFVTNEGKYTGFFFGLFQALPYIYKENRVFVVEGPFDFNALVKVFPNTVASLISGISEPQYEYLRLYCDTIISVFDTDKAGKKGRDKALKCEGVFSMDIGYKDPAKCLETLKFPAFKRFILKKTQSIPLLK